MAFQLLRSMITLAVAAAAVPLEQAGAPGSARCCASPAEERTMAFQPLLSMSTLAVAAAAVPLEQGAGITSVCGRRSGHRRFFGNPTCGYPSTAGRSGRHGHPPRSPSHRLRGPALRTGGVPVVLASGAH